MKRLKHSGIFTSAVFFIVTILMISIGSPTAFACNEADTCTAVPIRYNILINEQSYKLQAYEINGNDYFKLRGLALILNGTALQFQVEWNEKEKLIQIITEKPYYSNDSELKFSEYNVNATPSTVTIQIDNKKTYISAYCIEGSTYLKIIDIAKIIGFNISVDPTSTKIIISGSPVLNIIDRNTYTFTLLADNSDALLNGNPIKLSAKPFIQNDTFYIPLEAVTELLGGTFSFDNNIATIELFGVTTKYQIGSHTIFVNGEPYEVSGNRRLFNLTGNLVAVDDEYVPIISNGTVFLPNQFIAHKCPYNSILSVSREYPESNMVILGAFENERGIHEVKIMNYYDALPADFRSNLNYAGIVSEVINYSIEKYTNEDLEVYVMRIKEPNDDTEHMNGKICAIRMSGICYSTPRGLKVGDSAYRAWLLYGRDNLSYSFSYKVNGGIIKSLTFYTRYFGSQL